MFPPEFERSAAAELGEEEAAALLAALDGEAATSVRYNPFKLGARPAGTDAVPWCRYGAYLAERPVFTLDPAMHSGAYYVQEASSQFVEWLYRAALGGGAEADGEGAKGENGACAYGAADGGTSGTADVSNGSVASGVSDGSGISGASDGGALPEGVRLLDLCAAPGGKTTLYSTLVGPTGLVVANEVIRQRAAVLADNVRRWGVGNVVVTNNEAGAFGAYKHRFDVLAVDAPCSGEGMFRKTPAARDEWSPANVELCAARQRRILADAWDALRPGGVLIYSTCTFNRRENEQNVEWLTENFAVEPLEFDTAEPAAWGVECGEAAGVATFRFFPHRLRGEGFFVAAMRKADGRVKRSVPRARKEPIVWLNRPDSRPLAEWVAAPEAMKFATIGDNSYALYRPQFQAVDELAGGLNVIYSGVCMGRLFGGKLRPDHALALFHELRRGAASESDLAREEALDYLRKRDFAHPEGLAEGLNLLTFGGLPVGWIKRMGHRTNTMLPNNFRIVNL
jgi:16S rRNA C967 or C1407 C5-methylase (RsmB/RsmF family)/NOL1/NOP2/fmu family ribosome biogenesis protein